MSNSRFTGFRDVSPRGPDRTFRHRSSSGESTDPGDDALGDDALGNDSRGKKAAGSGLSPGGEGSEKKGSEKKGSEEVGTEEVGPEKEGGSQEESGRESPKDMWDEVRGLYDEDGGRSAARHAAAHAATEEQAFATPGAGGDLYAYDPESGVFIPNGEEVLREMLLEKLGPRHSTQEVRQIKAKVRAKAPNGRLGTAEVIPLAGGDLSLGSLELFESSRKRPFLYRSTARWDPSAECPSALSDALRRSVRSEAERRALQEYAGYCLLHWARPYRKALLLVGPGTEALRLYLRAIGAIVPWVGSVAPSRLAKSRSRGPQLHGPWVNICEGISPEALPKMELFQAFGPGRPVRSDPSTLEASQEKPVLPRPAKHVYTAEALPGIFPGKGFFRRLQLVSFSDGWSPEKPWRQLARELRAQRDGILRWAVKGLRRLLREGGFSLSRSPEETRTRWKANGDSVLRFKIEKLEVTGDLQRHFEPKAKTYEAYRRFCKAEGFRPIEKKGELTRQLKKDPWIKGGKRTPEGGDDQKRSYEGLTFRKV